jgi:ribose transport system substrate-binding protein
MRKFTRSLPLLAVAGGLAVSGCGSSSSSSGTRSGGAGAAGKEKAQAAVKEASAPVRFVAPGDAVEIGRLAGKTISVVTLDASVPFVQAALRGLKEAASAAHVKVEVFDAKGQTNNAEKGIRQAIAAKSAGLIVWAVNFDFVRNGIKAAKAARVPLIGVLNIDAGQPIPADSDGEVTVDYRRSGGLLAAYSIATTDGPVHAVYQSLPTLQTFVAMRDGMVAGFDSYCPQECSLKVDDFLQADFKAQAQTKTAAALARDPKLNWVFTAIDGIAQFAIPSIEAAGKADKVQVGSINAVQGNLQFIVDGKVQSVDIGNDNGWLGWAMLDRMFRAIDGEQPAVSTVPIKLFDAENLKGKNLADEDDLFDDVDYRGGYQDLWK